MSTATTVRGCTITSLFPSFSSWHHAQPEDAVAVLDLRPLDCVLVHGESLPEGEVLQVDLRVILKDNLEQMEDGAWITVGNGLHHSACGG